MPIFLPHLLFLTFSTQNVIMGEILAKKKKKKKKNVFQGPVFSTKDNITVMQET